MNIFLDVSILDIARLAPPFATGFQGPSQSGICRPAESSSSIPHAAEGSGNSIGRPGESSTSIGRAANA